MLFGQAGSALWAVGPGVWCEVMGFYGDIGEVMLLVVRFRDRKVLLVDYDGEVRVYQKSSPSRMK